VLILWHRRLSISHDATWSARQYAEAEEDEESVLILHGYHWPRARTLNNGILKSIVGDRVDEHTSKESSITLPPKTDGSQWKLSMYRFIATDCHNRYSPWREAEINMISEQGSVRIHSPVDRVRHLQMVHHRPDVISPMHFVRRSHFPSHQQWLYWESSTLIWN
jgi:hypothetical protein